MKKSQGKGNQNQTMEDIFRAGFDGAESALPPRIWENIDRVLDQRELQRYRRQIIWYRSIAAACLLLLCTTGLVLWQIQSTPSGVNAAGISLALQQKKDKDQKAAGSNVGENFVEKEVIASVLEPFARNQAQTEREVYTKATADTKVKSQVSGDDVLAGGVGQKDTQMIGAVPPHERIEAAAPNSQLEEARQIPSVVETIFPATQINTVLAKTEEEKGPANLVSPALSLAEKMSLSDSLLKGRTASIVVLKDVEPGNVAPVPMRATTVEKEQITAGRWSVTMAYAPQYAYTPVKLSQNQSPAVVSATMASQPKLQEDYQEAIDEFNKSYTPHYSYNTSVGTSYKINKKWSLESGVMYAQSEASTQHSLVVQSVDFSNVNKISPPGEGFDFGVIPTKAEPILKNNALKADATVLNVTRTDEYTTRYKYQQIGIPLRVAYRQSLKKLYAYMSGGVNFNLLLQNSIIPETNQLEAVHFTYKDEESPFRSWQWAAATSIGLGYDFTSNMSIVVGPEVTYSLSPIMKDAQQQADNYQIGISLGAKWRLFK